MINKRGQSMALSILSTIAIFIVGFTFLNFLMPEITNARVNLNCASASTISDGTKLLCLAIDGTIPYYILLIFSLGVGAITSRLNIG